MTEITTGRQLQAELHQKLGDALWTGSWDWLKSNFSDHRHEFWVKSHATHRVLRAKHEINDLQNPEIPVKGIVTALILSAGAFGLLIFCNKKVQKAKGSDRLFWERCTFAAVMGSTTIWMGSAAYLWSFNPEESIKNFAISAEAIAKDPQKHLHEYDEIKDKVIEECPKLKSVVLEVWGYERANFARLIDSNNQTVGLSRPYLESLEKCVVENYSAIQKKLRERISNPQFDSNKTPLQALRWALKKARIPLERDKSQKSEELWTTLNLWDEALEFIEDELQRFKNAGVGLVTSVPEQEINSVVTTLRELTGKMPDYRDTLARLA